LEFYRIPQPEQSTAVTPTAPTFDQFDITRPLEELESMTAEELLEEILRYEGWLDFVVDEMKMLVLFVKRKTKAIGSS
jgi:hypothetical protein